MRNFGTHSIDIVFDNVEGFEYELAIKPVHEAVDQYLRMPLSSVHDYVRCVQILQRHAGRGRRLIFRGHRDAAWDLIPTIMRHPAFRGKPDGVEIDAYERELVQQFLDLAMPHFKVPMRRDKEMWEILALAQHHRLPTRLLDWTYRAGTALFFALEDVDNLVAGVETDHDACVFAIFAPPVLNPRDHRHDSDKINDVYLYNPPHISPRITMQQGCFTAHPSHYLKREYRWINSEPRVVFTFAREHSRTLKEGLKSIGINQAALFPDLDGICGYLRDEVNPHNLGL